MKKNLLWASLVLGCAGYANVTVPAVFSDHGVLQTSPATAVFGKADPGEKVSVTYGNAKAETVAGKDGKWIVRLDLSKDDGKGKDLVIAGKNKITAKDVITGEVWFCIGQSNMAMTVGRSLNAKENVANSANDRIRHFRTNSNSPEKPVDTIKGRWVTASPSTTGNFTAAGYFFARKINKECGKAFGLINPSWGGSSIESWISHEKIMKGSTPAVAKNAQKELDAYFSYDKKAAAYVKKLLAWAKENKQISDGTSTAPAADAKWSKAKKLDRTQDGSGVIWYKKVVQLGKKDVKWGKVRFEFGRPTVPVKVFLDGNLIGELPMDNAVNGRQFCIWVPKKKVADGQHEVTLRVEAITPKFAFPRDHYIGDKRTVDGWMTCREVDFPKLNKKQASAMPKYVGAKPWGSKSPTMIWNGLVHPILPYTMKGALWYQGEQNSGPQRVLYGDQVKALVSDLRERFENPGMRFYAAQLPNFYAKNPDPNTTGNWVVIRDGQSKQMNHADGIAQAVIIDLGESRDIHPVDKEPVGERLAAIAMRNDYGKTDLPAYSPEAVSAKRDGSAVCVEFKYTDGGLVTRPLPDYYWVIRSQNQKAKLVRNSPDSEVEGFAICGKDGKWVWANAKISGNKVIVSAPAVKEPTAVRYAWQNNPTCNLYNGAGFPAAPFELSVK